MTTGRYRAWRGIYHGGMASATAGSLPLGRGVRQYSIASRPLHAATDVAPSSTSIAFTTTWFTLGDLHLSLGSPRCWLCVRHGIATPFASGFNLSTTDARAASILPNYAIPYPMSIGQTASHELPFQSSRQETTQCKTQTTP